MPAPASAASAASPAPRRRMGRPPTGRRMGVSARLDPSDFVEVRRIAREQGLSIGEVVRRAVVAVYRRPVPPLPQS